MWEEACGSDRSGSSSTPKDRTRETHTNQLQNEGRLKVKCVIFGCLIVFLPNADTNLDLVFLLLLRFLTLPQVLNTQDVV